MKEYAISWELFILVDFDDISDFDIHSSLHVPFSVLVEIPSRTSSEIKQHLLIFLVIGFLVFPPPLDVIKCLLDHRNEQYED